MDSLEESEVFFPGEVCGMNSIFLTLFPLAREREYALIRFQSQFSLPSQGREDKGELVLLAGLHSK